MRIDVVEHYATVELPPDFAELVTGNMAEALVDEQTSIRDLHASLTKRLADLDKREERLMDLAEEGLPQAKVRDRPQEAP